MSDNGSGKPINYITVLCDPRRVQRIGFTCRCGHRWTEHIPQELHDSDMTCQFECIQCGQLYQLHQKQLHRVVNQDKGESYDATAKQAFAAIRRRHDHEDYDA